MSRGSRANSKVVETVNRVFEEIMNGNLKPIALSVFNFNRPMDRWSPFNRAIVLSHGTTDARGRRQWEEVGRRVKEGAKPIHILVPVFKTEKKKDKKGRRREIKIGGKEDKIEEKEEEEEEEKKLTGFIAVPVYAVEDTEGDPLPEMEIKEEIEMNVRPLLKSLGLDLKIDVASFDGFALGRYYPLMNRIELATDNVITILHEITHALVDKLNIKLPREEEEVVAELTAAAWARLMGYEIPLDVKKYVEYFGGDVKSVRKNTRILSAIIKVMDYIIEKTAGTNVVVKEVEEEKKRKKVVTV